MEYKGICISAGIAIGKVYVYRPYCPQVKAGNIQPEQVTEAVERLRLAQKKAAEELELLSESMAASGDDKAKIIEAHLEILFDEAIEDELTEKIEEDLFTPDYAVEHVYEHFAALLNKSKDPLIAERQTDIRDVKRRLLRCLEGKSEKNLSRLKEPVIIAAHDLLPSDTAAMNKELVLGIVSELGGPTSHTAIIAKSYGIPAISGIEGLLERTTDGALMIADASAGLLITEPDELLISDYIRKQEELKAKAEIIRLFKDREGRTADDVRIEIGQNIGSADARELENAVSFDFVGLFRTEFLYMDSDHLPDEEEQFNAYKRALLAYRGKPVTLRTLDIGGDKTLSYLPLPKEENPALGNRALRLCLQRKDIFRTQLRAALRASVYGNLWLMLPMVGSMEDIHRAKDILESVKCELDQQQIQYNPEMKFGIMVEIPSIAALADKAAKEVDFASIGSNDLCQYLTASDRMNPQTASYYQTYHPAMFRMIKGVVEEFVKAGKSVSVCGEMGGDILAAPVLAGFGMRKLSMNAASAPAVKRILSMFTIDELREISDSVAEMDSQEKILPYLKEKFDI